jgi:hypothetical protein
VSKLLVILLIPLLLQVSAYLVVFQAAQGGGSFMGLLAIPAAAASGIALLGHGISSVRGMAPMRTATVVSLAIALVPPILLLIFRALES